MGDRALRSRQEKSVARLLLDGGMPFYLPQIKQTEKRSGRTFVSHLPLFPGYIFLRRVEGFFGRRSGARAPWPA